jgi:hypothetical protein
MQKNRFLTFIFSLIPGGGLMYLGYMKKGLQFMLMFTAAGLLGGFFIDLNTGWFAAMFLLTMPVIWFYQMFDAMHTVNRMKDQGVELPVDDGFIIPEKLSRFYPSQNRTVSRIIAGILILAGSVSLISNVVNNLWSFPIRRDVLDAISGVRHNIVPGIVSIILIVIGIKLLTGGKAKKTDDGGDLT